MGGWRSGRDWPKRRSQLEAALTGEAGCRVLGGTALFRLAEHPLSATLFAHLARKGILARPFKNRSVLRFGLPAGPEELERLRDAMQGML